MDSMQSPPQDARFATVAPPDEDATALQVLDVVRALVREVAPERVARVHLDAALEADLGVDSLARVELGLRLAQAMGSALDDDALADAVTPRDLLAAMFRLQDAPRPAAAPAATPPRSPVKHVPAEGGADDTPALQRAWQWARGIAVYAFVGAAGFAISLVPGIGRRRALTRVLARSTLQLLGIRLEVVGAAHIVRDRPVVIVANHGSYLDAIAITAAIDLDFAFVAKAEFADRWLPRHLLGRAGTHFVERFDPRKSVAHARALGRSVRDGGSLALFPEGTFLPRRGLLSFRLGAFVVAHEAGAPILPVAIAGARAALPHPSWRPRPGVVMLTIAPPIDTVAGPERDAFAHALGLRDVARAAILRHCGEHDANEDAGTRT